MKKIESLQSLRLIAFFTVFMAHCIPIKLTGLLGVAIFTSLSGFGLCYSFRDMEMDASFGNCMRFMWRRIRKLYPLHLFLLLLSVPLVINQAGAAAKFWTDALLNAALLQSWSTQGSCYFSFNAVSWYLSAAAFSYAVFPWLNKKIPENRTNGYYAVRIGLAALMILLVGLLGNCLNISCLWFSDNFAKWVAYIFPVTRVLNFYIGILMCHLYLKNKDRLEQISTAQANGLLAAAMVIYAVLLLLRYSPIALFASDGIQTNALLIPGVLALFPVFLINKDFLTRFLTKKCFLMLAELTPQLYLIHRVVILYVDKATESCGLQLPQWLRIPLCFAVSLLFAVIWKKAEAAVKFPRKLPKGKEN